MTKRRARLVLAAAATVLLLGGALAFGLARPSPQARVSGERPELMLLTTLPILFPETLTLDAPPSPVLRALEGRYRVIPISIASRNELRGRHLLLMAQPQAQPAEALVELDAWVRQGGRLLLLADPALTWPSERPPGDRLRPPPAFADTGLLAHWGLEFEGAGLAARGGDCVASGSFVARCRLGKGKATVIADADFLRGGDGRANLDTLLDELGRLQ